MGKRYCCMHVFLLLAAAIGGAVADDTAYVLQINPFERPEAEKSAENKPVQEREPPRLEHLRLRATLTAGSESLVNVDGVIVGIGEEFEGYRLVEVRRDQAIFSNGDELITLTLDQDTENAKRN